GAESTVERLRNFRSLVRDASCTSPRISKGDSEPLDVSPSLTRGLVQTALERFESAMDDDFNTAAALGAIHDMVRETNTIMANDALMSDDQAAVLDAIAKF